MWGTLSPDDFFKYMLMNHIEKYTRWEEEAMGSFVAMLVEQPSIPATAFIKFCLGKHFAAIA